ncbi:hypothetical protein ACQY0O_004163 [Thecaphora frezii]
MKSTNLVVLFSLVLAALVVAASPMDFGSLSQVGEKAINEASTSFQPKRNLPSASQYGLEQAAAAAGPRFGLVDDPELGLIFPAVLDGVDQENSPRYLQALAVLKLSEAIKRHVENYPHLKQTWTSVLNTENSLAQLRAGHPEAIWAANANTSIRRAHDTLNAEQTRLQEGPEELQDRKGEEILFQTLKNMVEQQVKEYKRLTRKDFKMDPDRRFGERYRTKDLIREISNIWSQ